jgi:hypothetical protein
VPADVVPYSKSSLTFLTQVLEIFFCAMHTILPVIKIVFIFECCARNTVVDIKLKNWQKNSFNVLFLFIKFCKNLRFSLSEHCERGTRHLFVIFVSYDGDL